VLTTRKGLIALSLVLLAVAGAGIWLMTDTSDGMQRRHVVVDGVPLDEVRPGGGERRPGIVVAHGFAGSARLMAQFGDSLAARGYAVVLLDFDGHGANTRPLPDSSASTDDSAAALARDLDVAVAHLRSLPDVDPARIALVGHSMGAGAVTRYAVAHPDITATVALSLPNSWMVTADRPARLLLLVGAFEFPDFHAQAERTGRPLVTVPGVEHITILYSRRAHQETADWLDESFGRTPAAVGSPVRRIGGAGLLLIALLVGLYPIARLLFGATTAPWPRFRWPPIAVAVAATGAGALLARFLPTNNLPLAVGGYVIGFTAASGAGLIAYAIRRRPKPAPNRRPAAIVLIGYAAVTIAVPIHLGLTYARPVGDRWWLLALVWAGFAVLQYGAERATDGNPLGVLAVSAVAVAALTGAAVVGLTYSFVLLVVPLLVVLMLFQAVWSAILNRFSAPPWLISIVGAALVAWPIAATLPLIR
jgi:dienelactone hydrolase